jgi:signal transduction histidine kinase
MTSPVRADPLATTPPSARRDRARGLSPNLIVAIAGIAVVAALIGFAAELSDTQSTARRGVITRFQDRAAITSALVEAIFTATSTSSDASKQYGSGPVSDRELGKAAKSGRLDYAAILDKSGSVIAVSPGLPPAAAKRLASRPAPIAAALQGKRFTVSEVLRTGPGGAPVIELVQALEGTDRRVAVSGVSPALLNVILGSYLAKIPLRGPSHAYLVDAHGVVVASRDAQAQIGRGLNESGLRGAVGKRKSGPFGQHRFFVSTPVQQTPWRVVLTSSQGRLFASVSGTRKWTPWMIFGAFALAAAIALILLRRMLNSRAALGLANDKLHEANDQLAGRNALLREAAELTRSNAELEQFASIASHDLQEPLRKVQTFAAQLNATERERLSDEGKDYLRRMSDAAGRMRMLIDDLLMFSRVSTKGRAFAEVDLGEVADLVVTDLEIAIEEAGAHVVVDDLPTISADRTQMRQLLQNLIANALKFRRPGVTPEVHVTAHPANGTAEISVSDNGIGFDPQYGTRIFRAFERLHSRGDYPGTGIGLALCRKIVERHHGTITATGEPGAGAVFTFVLPVDQEGDDVHLAGDSEDIPEQVTHASA